MVSPLPLPLPLVISFYIYIYLSIYPDFLGCAKLSLKELREEGPGPWKKRLLLEDVAKGELELKIAYRQMQLPVR